MTRPSAFSQPTSYGTWALAGMRLSQGSFDGRGASDKPTEGFTSEDSAINAAYALRLNGAARIGGNVKYLRSSIANA